jgi:hypothetical protein
MTAYDSLHSDWTTTDSILIWLESESESELLYDWRFTVNQFVLAPTPWDSRPVITFSTEHLQL